MRFLPALLLSILLPATPLVLAEEPAAATTGVDAGEGLELQSDHPTRYVVKAGDTLWAIAGKFLKDPSRWRELWRGDQRSGDPDRIYPGDVLELTWQEGKPSLTVQEGESADQGGAEPAADESGPVDAIGAGASAATMEPASEEAGILVEAPTETAPAATPTFDPQLSPWPDEEVTTTDEPDLTPPAIDGWFDISFTDADFDNLGFNQTAGGYRFIAGFHLESISTDRIGLAPEVGYFRIGNIDEKTSTSVSNPPDFQGYIQTTTHTSSADATSLDFGVRVNFALARRLEAFLRTGVGFYHLSTEEQDSFSYTPITPGGAPIPSSRSTTASNTQTGIAPYAALGLAVKLGTIPSLYGEYGTRAIDGENISVIAVGFLLNF
ncbi:MAG: LysM peptidoglycan-binding domain-containing protein [Gammaproteobacteria bacterium]